MASSLTSDLDTDSNTSPPTILNRLKPPQKSDLSQKRKMERPKTTGADKKRKSGVSNSTNPKTVSSAVRHVKEFTGEYLDIRNEKLFCVACREELSVKKSTIKNYLYSGRKHKDTKLKLAKKEARERDIADCLVAYV